MAQQNTLQHILLCLVIRCGSVALRPVFEPVFDENTTEIYTTIYNGVNDTETLNIDGTVIAESDLTCPTRKSAILRDNDGSLSLPRGVTTPIEWKDSHPKDFNLPTDLNPAQGNAYIKRWVSLSKKVSFFYTTPSINNPARLTRPFGPLVTTPEEWNGTRPDTFRLPKEKLNPAQMNDYIKRWMSHSKQVSDFYVNLTAPTTTTTTKIRWRTRKTYGTRGTTTIKSTTVSTRHIRVLTRIYSTEPKKWWTPLTHTGKQRNSTTSRPTPTTKPKYTRTAPTRPWPTYTGTIKKSYPYLPLEKTMVIFHHTFTEANDSTTLIQFIKVKNLTPISTSIISRSLTPLGEDAITYKLPYRTDPNLIKTAYYSDDAGGHGVLKVWKILTRQPGTYPPRKTSTTTTKTLWFYGKGG